MEYINMDLYLYSSDGYLGLVILLCFVRGVQLPADRGYVSSSVFVFVCVCVGSLLLRRSVHFDIDRATLSSLCACQIDVAVARCWGSCSEILTMRSVLADLRRDLDKRSLPEILLRDLSERTCTDILFKDL